MSAGLIMKHPFAGLAIGLLVICVALPGPAVAKSLAGQTQVGLASYYGMGKRTASGERFNPKAMTAAHRTLPFGTRVRVKSLKTGRSVVVRINDRGPFIKKRIIDLSTGAARALGIQKLGVARVSVRVLR